MKLQAVVDIDDLLKSLDSEGSMGLDLSPGDPLARTAAAVIRELLPKPGTGACICKFSPKTAKEFATRTNTAFEHWQGGMTLDHRCMYHGEKAQPDLWGRHKTLELVVNPCEWLALGVERPE